MKTIWRILIILVVSAIIGGVTYFLVGPDSSAVAGEEMARPVGSEQGLPGSEGFRQGEGLHAKLEGAFAWIETVRNLVVVSALVWIVALIERSTRNRRTRKTVQVPVNLPEEERKK